jgi:hypothetical protein
MNIIQKEYEKETGDSINNCDYSGRYIKWLDKKIEEKDKKCKALRKEIQDLKEFIK